MDFIKQSFISQMEATLLVYNSFPDKLNEVEQKNLKEITQCLQILKKDNGK